MPIKFIYKDSEFYCHRTLNESPKDEDFNMHAHDLCEIFYFISGNCKIVIEGTEYSLRPHDVLIMRPAEAHKLRVLTNEPYERIAVRFSPNTLKGINQSETLKIPFFERDLGKLNLYREENFTSNLYRLCLETLDEKSPIDKGDEIQYKIFLLLCEIYKAYEKREDKAAIKSNTDISSRLIDYINKNLFANLSLSLISQEFYMSQSQINRIFRKITGSSVWEYITIKRLLTARNSIREGESIGKVCVDCGFNDYSSFYRIYKKTFGHSPREDVKQK